MITVKEILDFSETFAPFSSAMDYDNCGLLVGSLDDTVSNVLVSLDVTLDVIKEALDLKAELIISHHPVIFSPIKTLHKHNIPYLLAQHNIAAVCLHTNLDLSPEFGVNYCLAKALELDYIQILDEKIPAMFGVLKEPYTNEAFADYVREKLKCPGVRFTKSDNLIQTVLVSSGSGGENVHLCGKVGADAFVTGEIKHHQILQSMDLGIMVVDTGHFASEDVVIEPLCRLLSHQFHGIEFTKSKSLINPVRYL